MAEYEILFRESVYEDFRKIPKKISKKFCQKSKHYILIQDLLVMFDNQNAFLFSSNLDDKKWKVTEDPVKEGKEKLYISTIGPYDKGSKYTALNVKYPKKGNVVLELLGKK